MPKAWADSAVPPHPATTSPFGMVQFTGPRNEADAALVAEALTALPGLLDEVELGRRDEARLIAARAEMGDLRSERDDWLRMYLEAVRVAITTCVDVTKRIEAGGSLADVVDLVGDYLDNGCDGLLDDEKVDLLMRAKAVANGEASPRAEAEGQQAMTWAEAHDELGDIDFTPEPAPAERKVVDLMAALEQSVNDAKAAARKAKGGES